MIRAGIWLAALAAVAPLTGCGNGAAAGGQGQAQMPVMPMASRAAEANPNLDLGSSLGGQPAPDFRLDNQFGQPMSLSQFRGKVIILAFTDSQCTTVCPLTTASMLQARQLLGAAGTNVQLLGVNANPHADSVADVLAYSRAHDMVNQWDFLTGTDAQLEATWREYHTFPPANSLPTTGLLGGFFHRDRSLPGIMQRGGRASPALRFQLARPGRFPPNSRVGLHAQGIKKLALFQLLPKRGDISIARVGYDDPLGQSPTACLVDHL